MARWGQIVLDRMKPLLQPVKGLRSVAKKKKRPSLFSATKAVKANARARLGTPPPSVPIPDRSTKTEHGPRKHKKSVEELILLATRGEEI